MKLYEVNSNGLIIGYNCRFCKFYNDLLTTNCRICQANRPEELNYLASLEAFRRKGEIMSQDKIELHKKFYFHERTLVKDMTALQLREHIEELQVILFEAKARAAASLDEERERKARLSASQRDGLITTPNLDGSDALREIKQRKARMSKADKLSAMIAGIAGDDVAASLIKNVHNKNLDKSLITNSQPKIQNESALCMADKHTDCNGRFRTEHGSFTCKCDCHKPKPIQPNPTQFNPANLFKKN
jgi:hypothetical protein